MSPLKPTDELLNTLNRAKSAKHLNHYLENLDTAGTFADYYFSLPEVKRLETRELIARSGIERSYFYQIKKRRRNPGRDKIIALCLAANLPLREVTRCLEIAETAILYPRNHRDAIIIYAIKNHLSLAKTNELLDMLNESVIA